MPLSISMSLPENFCIAPFVQMTTHPSGTYSPCPYLGGTTWYDSKSFKDKWSSSAFENLRTEFLDNQRSSICTRCWDEEAAGKKSLRLRMLDPVNLETEYKIIATDGFNKDVEQYVNSGEYKSGPKILSIKNGNVCNAKCRSCHPEDSSKWIQDANKQKAHADQQFFKFEKQVFYKTGLRESNWDNDQVDQLLELFPNLKRLELFGGEPLYNKKVIGLLNKAIDLGHGTNMDLYVNTNGSVNILQKIKHIDQFNEIDIGVSIDAPPEHFSYVRHPLKFSAVQENVKNWLNYFIHNNINYNLQSISTVSIYNVLYLPELEKEIIALTGHSPFWNILIYPKHLSIASLPLEVKNTVADKLKKYGGFDEIINFMFNNATSEQDLKEFFAVRDQLDSIRNESFADTFPELHQLLESNKPVLDRVIVFIGDLSQDYHGQYLEYMTRTHGHNTCHLLSDLENIDNTVLVTEVDGVKHQLELQDLAPGYYYTGVTKWSDIAKLQHVLKKAHEIVYAPPEFWSDGPTEENPNLPSRGWSKKITEDLLEDIDHRVILPIT